MDLPINWLRKSEDGSITMGDIAFKKWDGYSGYRISALQSGREESIG